MYRKFLSAFAACLPLALAGCSGGGSASSPPASQSPSAGSGMQTAEAALDAAKTAVDNANSAKTEAAVQRARRALAEAVETAQAALDAAEAALDEARDYRETQTDVLERLQQFSASASLAAVTRASTPARAAQALAYAKDAMAVATSTMTPAAIQAARRALAEAVETAQAALEAAEAALDAARAYSDAQTPAIASIQTQPETTAETPPSSPPGEFDVTHTDQSYLYSGTGSKIDPPSTATWQPVFEAHWRNSRNDARDLANGFSQFGPKIDGITTAQKTFRRNPNVFQRYFTGIGHYSAFQVVRDYINLVPTGSTGSRWEGGYSYAFGERSRCCLRDAPWIDRAGFTDVVYRGAMAGVRYVRAGRHEAGEAFTGEATLTYSIKPAGSYNPERISVRLNERNPDGSVRRCSGSFPPTDCGWSYAASFGLQAADVDRFPNGTFSNAPRNTVKGAFYGPNWEEAAGIVETDDVYGAWLVQRVEGD